VVGIFVSISTFNDSHLETEAGNSISIQERSDAFNKMMRELKNSDHELTSEEIYAKIYSTREKIWPEWYGK
jgi:hypothetical protein